MHPKDADGLNVFKQIKSWNSDYMYMLLKDDFYLKSLLESLHIIMGHNLANPE